MYSPPPGAMTGLRELCDEHGILLITDEAVTGFGRTGTMWAVEQEGFLPDVLTLEKGITHPLHNLSHVLHMLLAHLQARQLLAIPIGRVGDRDGTCGMSSPSSRRRNESPETDKAP